MRPPGAGKDPDLPSRTASGAVVTTLMCSKKEGRGEREREGMEMKN